MFQQFVLIRLSTHKCVKPMGSLSNADMISQSDSGCTTHAQGELCGEFMEGKSNLEISLLPLLCLAGRIL
jgi:hypothetical protein